MRAIVTGGQGFIGHNLCTALMNDQWANWQVTSVDDLSGGCPSNRVHGVMYCHFSILDEDFENLVATAKPDVIFHLAAIPRVSFSVENPAATAKANLGGTLKILEIVRKYSLGTRIINSSSSSIYGGASQLPTPESYLANPQSPYALQKWHAEEWCRMYAKFYDIDVVTLRYFNVIGPHSRFGGAYSTVLSAWLYHICVDRKYKPFLEGDGMQSRDFCNVTNVVQANMLCAVDKRDYFAGQAYNIAQGSSHTLLDCKEILEKITGCKLNLEERPERLGDVKHTLADISFARQDLKYTPDTDFEQQVRTMAEWYLRDYANDKNTAAQIQQTH